MLFDGEFSDAWGDGEPRESRFCFIGKNLDREQVPAALALDIPLLRTHRYRAANPPGCPTGTADHSGVQGLGQAPIRCGEPGTVQRHGRLASRHRDQGARVVAHL